MASLKELEEDIKQLIERKNNNSFFNYKLSDSCVGDEYKKAVEQSENIIDTPYNKLINNTLMLVKEHGQPFNKRTDYSRMAVKEHGQPYLVEFNEELKKLQNERIGVVTNMAVKEHGQPFKCNSTYMVITEHGQPFKCKSTDMVVKEHGQPYNMYLTDEQPVYGQHFKSNWESIDKEEKPFRFQTKMAVREHGQPYNNINS